MDIRDALSVVDRCISNRLCYWKYSVLVCFIEVRMPCVLLLFSESIVARQPLSLVGWPCTMYADSKFYFASCSGDKHLFPASLDGAFASVCIMSIPTLFRPRCLIFGFFLARVFFISPPLDCLEAARHVLYVFLCRWQLLVRQMSFILCLARYCCIKMFVWVEWS